MAPSCLLQVVRLPLLRQAVHAWMEQQDLPVPQPNPPPEALAAADPRVPGWVADLRCGDVSRRGIQAAARINDVLIEWGADEAASEELKQHRDTAMEVGMLWTFGPALETPSLMCWLLARALDSKEKSGCGPGQSGVLHVLSCTCWLARAPKCDTSSMHHLLFQTDNLTRICLASYPSSAAHQAASTA
jgi:hypothetical protein